MVRQGRGGQQQQPRGAYLVTGFVRVDVEQVSALCSLVAELNAGSASRAITAEDDVRFPLQVAATGATIDVGQAQYAVVELQPVVGLEATRWRLEDAKQWHFATSYQPNAVSHRHVELAQLARASSLAFDVLTRCILHLLADANSILELVFSLERGNKLATAKRTKVVNATCLAIFHRTGSLKRKSVS